MSNLLARAINCDDPASDAAPAVAAWPEVGRDKRWQAHFEHGHYD